MWFEKLGGAGVSFREVMEGSVQREGERFDRPFRFELLVEAPRVTGFVGTAHCRITGRVRLDGVTRDAAATGTLDVSLFLARTLRYELGWQDEKGRAGSFLGEKTLTPLHLVRSLTTLPGSVTVAGLVYGTALLHFSLGRHLAPMLRSVRLAHG
jgi:hypothetical protein